MKRFISIILCITMVLSNMSVGFSGSIDNETTSSVSFDVENIGQKEDGIVSDAENKAGESEGNTIEATTFKEGTPSELDSDDEPDKNNYAEEKESDDEADQNKSDEADQVKDDEDSQSDDGAEFDQLATVSEATEEESGVETKEEDEENVAEDVKPAEKVFVIATESTLKEKNTDVATASEVEEHVNLELLKGYREPIGKKYIGEYEAPKSKFELFGETFDASYDPRNKTNSHGLSLMAPVRTQNYGDCWAHACVGVIEASIRKKGLVSTDEEANLSEAAVQYFKFHLRDINSNPTYSGNPGIQGDDYVNFKYDHLGGGGASDDGFVMGSSYIGFVTEDENSGYNKMSSIINNGLDLSYGYNKNAFVIADYEWIYANDKDAMKRAIVNNGSTTMSLNADMVDGNLVKDSDTSRNGKNISKAADGESYYFSDSPSVNHEVVVVGWNDNIPASYFTNLSGNHPSNNGGWLCRNSWGDSHPILTGGYFWISYEDPCCSSGSKVVSTANAIKADTYKYNYHYDSTTSWEYNNTLQSYYGGAVGNVFKVSDDEDQTLDAISFAVYNANNFTIEIYTKPTQMSNPVDGTLAHTQDVNNSYGIGSFTIPLTTKVPLTKSTYYSIVLRSKDGSSISSILDHTNTEFDTADALYNEVKLGQSFKLNYGSTTWEDINAAKYKLFSWYGETNKEYPETISGKLYGRSLRIRGLANPATTGGKTVQSISIKPNTVKTAYTAGEKFDPTGLVIEVTYSDTSTEDVGYSDTTKSEFSFNKTDAFLESGGANQTVEVTYKGKKATINVTVKFLSSIAVDTTSTNKTKYKAGEKYDPTGLKLVLTYSDTTTGSATYSNGSTGWTFNPSGELVGTNTSVTIGYLGKTTTQAIEVITLQSISIKPNTAKTAYTAGEKFDPTGLVIEVTYSDTSTEEVGYSDITKSEFSFNKTDAFLESGGANQSVEVTYKGKKATINVTVKFLSSIAVDTTSTNKTKYKAGEKYDPTGLKLVLTYSDTTTGSATYSSGSTGWTFDPSGELVGTNTSVTIGYLGKTTTQTIEVITISTITITTPPTKLSYLTGDYFDPAGLELDAVFADNSNTTITYSDATKQGFKFNGANRLLLNVANENFEVEIDYCGATTKQIVKVERRQSSNYTPSSNSSGSSKNIISNSNPQNNKPTTPTNNNHVESKISVSFNSVPVSHNTSVLSWGKTNDGKWKMNYLNQFGQVAQAKNMWVNVNTVVNINGIKAEVKDYYFFDNKGEMLTGWVSDATNQKRFLETTNGSELGKMVRGWKQIDNNYYYFDGNGFLVTGGMTPDGYKVDGNGAWVR